MVGSPANRIQNSPKRFLRDRVGTEFLNGPPISNYLDNRRVRCDCFHRVYQLSRVSHIVLVLVGVRVLEQVTLGGPTVINPCVFAKMESIGSSKCWAEDAVSRTRTTTRTRATKTLSLNAHSPPTGLLCSKIDDVADSLTFVPGPRL